MFFVLISFAIKFFFYLILTKKKTQKIVKIDYACFSIQLKLVIIEEAFYFIYTL